MTKPNIIWIQCDELRADALGCYGNRYAEMQTPHVDSIAEMGTRFTNTFCNSSVCVASRTSVLTGLPPVATGVYHNEGTWPTYQMSHSMVTFPQVFASNGYRTANFGKSHVHSSFEVWQHSNTDGASMGEFFDIVNRDDPSLIRRKDSPVVIGGQFPADVPFPAERVTQNALKWIGQVEDEPFLVRLSYLQPHTPVLPPAPFDTLYADAGFPRTTQINPNGSQYERLFAQYAGGAELSEDELFRVQSEYYGLMARIDIEVGHILNYLDENNLLEQTIIVFDADHGTSLGDGGRFQKQSFAPESHRIPRIISWKNTLAQGDTNNEITEGLDLANTLLDLAEINRHPQFRGRNVFADPAPDAVFATLGYGFSHSLCYAYTGVGSYVDGHGWPRRACIRTSRYRLDKNIRIDGKPVSDADQDIFLADMLNDPYEENNLVGDSTLSDVVDQLCHQLDDYHSEATEVPEEYTIR